MPRPLHRHVGVLYTWRLVLPSEALAGQSEEIASIRSSTPIVEVKRRGVAEQIVYGAYHPQPQLLHLVSTRGHRLIALPTGEIDPKPHRFQLLRPGISLARLD